MPLRLWRIEGADNGMKHIVFTLKCTLTSMIALSRVSFVFLIRSFAKGHVMAAGIALFLFPCSC